MDKSEAGKLGYLASCRTHQSLYQNRLRAYEQNPKRCKYCGKILAYEKRKNTFCNSSCFASYNNSNRGSARYCRCCGKVLKKKNKTYCSVKCQHEYEFQIYIQNWQKGIENGKRGKWDLSAHIRRFIFAKYNNMCASCGCDLKNPYTNKSILEIHHIDGNHENNQESNLILLCPNCHAMTDNYKFIGSRRGRAKAKFK